MLQEGQSDSEIKSYMVARYGDYVLYRPELNNKTILLWLGPLILVLVGLTMAVMIMRRQRPAEEAVEIDKAKLEAILQQARSEKEKDSE